MDWQKELEARLVDDPRLERKPSRTVDSVAFFFKGREVANFPKPASILIRLGAAGIYALGPLTAHEAVDAVSADAIVVRLESEADLEFASKLLERVYREKAGERRPQGKKTRRAGPSGKGSKAMKAFGDAQALKALKEFQKESDED